MLQPFERFKPEYIDGLLRLNRPYLVSQTYHRANQSDNVAILLTDYDDIGLAEMHQKAVRHDRYAVTLDLSKPAHLSKIKQMLQPESGYQLYWSVVKSKQQIKKRLDLDYKDAIRHWIEQNTDWRLSGADKIGTVLQVIYGELFLSIKKGSQTRNPKFEEIEKS